MGDTIQLLTWQTNVETEYVHLFPPGQKGVYPM